VVAAFADSYGLFLDLIVPGCALKSQIKTSSHASL
jgi:hypothetical protein